MKLLTRLRELQNKSPVDELFDNFYYSPENYRTNAYGIGSVTREDIARLDINNQTYEPKLVRKD